jgi:anaerobic magnesium-protoporphyrin IX monomethyl ester cyclase
MNNNSIASTDSQEELKLTHIVERKNISKILLIQPPAFCNNQRDDMNPNAPLGIAYVASSLESKGYKVEILDAFIEGWTEEERVDKERLRVGLSFDKIETYISNYNPDVVGITSMFTSQRKNVHDLANVVKTISDQIVVIVGGAHPSAATESVISDDNIDFAVLGEGEKVIVELLNKIKLGSDLTLVEGIAFKGHNEKFIINNNNSGIQDLDSLPFPARHLLPMEKYFKAGVRHGGGGKGKRTASIISSRGCQFKCNFCTAFVVFTRKPRMRSVENVTSEIQHLKDNYSIDEIFFEDDQLFAKRARSLALLDALSKFNLYWDTPNGISPWLLTDEIIDKMAKSGCYRVNLAIESGVQEVLDDIINKPVKLKDIPRIVKKIKSHSMEVCTFLVVGNISWNKIETLSQIKESFRFCRTIGVPPHVSLLTAYPGSETLKIAEKKGYLIEGFTWDKLTIDQCQLETEFWTPMQLKKLIQKERTITKLYLFAKSPLFSFYYVIRKFISSPIQTSINIDRAIRTLIH